MKTSRTEAAEARQRIVMAAADRFRRDGITETGLAGFVPEAGLTAGGFYCHFDFQGRVVGRGTRTRVGSGRRYDAGRFGPLRLRIQLRNLRRRLSLGRTSGRSLGFPFAALRSEVARADGLTRSVATNGFLKLSIWLQDPEKGRKFGGEAPRRDRLRFRNDRRSDDVQVGRRLRVVGQDSGEDQEPPFPATGRAGRGPMKWNALAEQSSSLCNALSVIGDRWTLLILNQCS